MSLAVKAGAGLPTTASPRTTLALRINERAVTMVFIISFLIDEPRPNFIKFSLFYRLVQRADNKTWGKLGPGREHNRLPFGIFWKNEQQRHPRLVEAL